MLKGEVMDMNYYDISEIFEDIDSDTVDLFSRKNFTVEDIGKLKNLQNNLRELDYEIDIKIQNIVKEFIGDF
jgi:hypothetical protein